MRFVNYSNSNESIKGEDFFYGSNFYDTGEYQWQINKLNENCIQDEQLSGSCSYFAFYYNFLSRKPYAAYAAFDCRFLFFLSFDFEATC